MHIKQYDDGKGILSDRFVRKRIDRCENLNWFSQRSKNHKLDSHALNWDLLTKLYSVSIVSIKERGGAGTSGNKAPQNYKSLYRQEGQLSSNNSKIIGVFKSIVNKIVLIIVYKDIKGHPKGVAIGLNRPHCGCLHCLIVVVVLSNPKSSRGWAISQDLPQQPIGSNPPLVV